jgi:hypothetical protein|tara:strand:+ start:591 stop:1892 length:1302 start_codon:yes stop_codon:yes gene_type:complete
MQEIKVTNVLTSKQMEFFDLNNKYIVIVAGRRFGKGELAVRFQTIKHALQKETDEDNPHAWVAPTFRQSKLGYYKTLRFLKLNNIAHTANKSELYIDIFPQKKGSEITFFSRVQFFSLDRPDLIEGFSFMSLVMDESGISLKNPEVWENSLAPTTLDHDCPVLFIGTPKGKNLYYKFYLNGLDKTKPEWCTVTASTYDNTIENGGTLQKHVIDELVKQLPEHVIEQEIYAKFVDSGGSVFRKSRICAKGSFQKYSPKKKYIAGLDLAKVNDYTVMTIGTVEGEVVHIERLNQLDWNIQKEIVYNLSKDYGRCKILMDSTGVGDPIFEDLKRMRIPVDGYHFTHNSKRELINKLIVSTENESISYPPYKQLLLELDAYEYTVSTAGNIKTNAPLGFHDDCVISLALFNWLVSGATKLTELDISVGDDRLSMRGW